MPSSMADLISGESLPAFMPLSFAKKTRAERVHGAPGDGTILGSQEEGDSIALDGLATPAEQFPHFGEDKPRGTLRRGRCAFLPVRIFG